MRLAQMKESLFAALLGALVAGCGSWLAFGTDKVTRDEMSRHVADRSPWVLERGEVLSTLRTNGDKLVELESRVRQLLDAQVQLMVEVKLTSQKVDRLLQEKDNR